MRLHSFSRDREQVHHIESRTTAMKILRKGAKKSRHFGIIQKNGRVVLPPDFTQFRLGQRVYFHLRSDGVAIASTPKRIFGGRLLSCRIRRGLRTLAMYGPRAAYSE